MEQLIIGTHGLCSTGQCQASPTRGSAHDMAHGIHDIRPTTPFLYLILFALLPSHKFQAQ
eukprot:scaffold30426_cov25-Prasinocladus_malaysianus.AAC.3